jgi:hypothetical protein
LFEPKGRSNLSSSPPCLLPRAGPAHTYSPLRPILRLARIRDGQLDVWQLPADRSGVAEVYPRMWSGSFEREGRAPNQYDALAVARGGCSARPCRRALFGFLKPGLTPSERSVADAEGRIFCVGVWPAQRLMG